MPLFAAVFHEDHDCEYHFAYRCIIKKFDHVSAGGELLNAAAAVLVYQKLFAFVHSQVIKTFVIT